jgi:Flp pilus assembly protein TadG
VTRGRGGDRPGRGDGGQSAVEFALVLPLLAALLLVLVQVGLLVRDQVLVIHAAREAVRQVAVQEGERADGPGLERLARDAAIAATGSALDATRLEVAVEISGARVGVRVGYRAPFGVPIPGLGRKDVRLAAFAQMTREID